jgi:hypothetical protein
MNNGNANELIRQMKGFTMINHPIILFPVVQARYKNRLKAAESYRLFKQAQVGRSRLVSRWLLSLLNFLVFEGLWF